VAGATALELDPSTLPTPLSMVNVVGVPPDRVHDNVED